MFSPRIKFRTSEFEPQPNYGTKKKRNMEVMGERRWVVQEQKTSRVTGAQQKKPMTVY